MKIFVSCCSYRRPKFSNVTSILNMLDYADKRGIEAVLLPRENEALICRARNRALKDFMETDATHLMTIDDDLIFAEDTIVQLVNAKAAAIGGFYRLKTGEYGGTATRVVGHDYRPAVLEKKIVPADYLATGCMMTKRFVIEDMIGYYPDLEYQENLTQKTLWAFYQPFIHFNGEFREYLSEDWAFCQRIKDAGYELLAHGGVTPIHRGEIHYTMEIEEDGE